MKMLSKIAAWCKPALGVIALGMAGSGVLAQDFPNRPIRVVVGFAAGGAADTAMRALAVSLERELGQRVVVEQRVGAAGTVAANVVAKAEPDGYTLLIAEHAAVVYQDLIMTLPYDPYRDLAIVSPVFNAPFVLALGPAMPASVNSIKDLIAEAKANPGKYAYGHSGNGTMHHLTVELLKQRAGIDLTPIPYKGSAMSITDLIGGQVPILVSGVSAIDAHLKGGKIRPLAVSTATRWPAWPNVPTISETVPGFVSISYASLFVPVKTPRDIVQKLNAATSNALKDPETVKKFAGIGVQPSTASVEQSNQSWLAERKQWAPVIKALDIKPN